MRKLYKFYWDCGRQGHLEGVFAASEEEVEAAYGETIYFGEVLGKHSDVSGNLERTDLRVLTEDQDFIDKAIEYKLIPTGYNPLSYMEE